MQAPASPLTGLPPIPAMTTDAERECYYRLVRESAGQGAIIEFGAWLGASTAYIAAAVRDAGASRAHVYDKFESKAGHAAKVDAFYAQRGMESVPMGPCFEDFEKNLGPLLEFVEVHRGQIEDMTWGDDRIAVLISDAPKRVPQISAVLTTLRHGLQPGSIMAWQDFCHFPSYEIPACLYRLRDRIQFVEAVVPGTTMVFRVASQWDADEVSPEALAISRWTEDEIERAGDFWSHFVPPEKRALFECGAALFLCDIGKPDAAVEWFSHIYAFDKDEILPKWQYIHRSRSDLVRRYQPLFDFLARRGAL